MKRIPLTRGLFAWVDDEDYEKLIWRHITNKNERKWTLPKKWQASKSLAKEGFYASTYYQEPGTSKRVFTYMHREIMSCPDGMEVHHIDRNKLNNQKSNLMVVTHRENLRHRRLRAHPYFDKYQVHRPWKVILSNQYHGSFETEAEALAYIDKVYLWTCFLPPICWQHIAWKSRKNYDGTEQGVAPQV